MYANGNMFVPWDFTCRNTFLEKTIINDGVHIIQDSVNPCSLAYIVTLQGAKNLVDHFYKTGFLRATDWNYNDYLINKNNNYGSRIVLCTGNEKLGSDVY